MCNYLGTVNGFKIITFWNYNWSKNCVSSSITMISRKKVTYIEHNFPYLFHCVLQSVRDTNYLVCSWYNTRPEIFFSLLATIHLVLPSHGGNLLSSDVSIFSPHPFSRLLWFWTLNCSLVCCFTMIFTEKNKFCGWKLLVVWGYDDVN